MKALSLVSLVSTASLVSLVCLVCLVSPANAAVEAPTDCPPGSIGKASGAFSWCEPSVCLHDGNCSPGEVCRTVPLCVEVGTLADAGKAGEQRLVATQRCGAAGACPSSQTCSTKDRCLSKLQAQKLGLLDAPAAASSASGAPTAAEPKKSSCGCEVAGEHGSGWGAAFAFGLAATMVAARRRARR